MARRDSILKHSGSVKNTERRVSIKQNQPAIVEYLSERRPSQSHLASAATNNKSNARPASLILTKGDRPSFKLIRSPSIDQEQDEELACALEAAANQAKLSTQAASGQQLLDSLVTTDMSSKHYSSKDSTKDNVDDDDDDESAPLVQINDSTTITSSANHV